LLGIGSGEAEAIGNMKANRWITKTILKVLSPTSCAMALEDEAWLYSLRRAFEFGTDNAEISAMSDD